ncbi:MAG: hypothetical protein JXA54_16705 [Candidatus Heimdallarchaeota archaeon]|nr:hypothetical protein [Candidatus Heimdallarchaeota archaeon]
MYKDVTEIAFLTAFGKANLAGKSIPFTKSHPGAINFRNMRFVTKEPTTKQLLPKEIITKDPNYWFKYLNENKFTKLHLVYQPEVKLKIKAHYKHFFDGKGSPWYIFAERGSTYDVWKQQWQAEFGETISYYYLVIEDMELEKISSLSLETTIRFLKIILDELIDYTNRNRLANWSTVFQAALDKFAVKNPLELLSEEYLPDDCYTLEAKQILAACDQAWVFGGMGSWSDVVQVDNYDVYRRLTDNLYDTLNNSVAAAINSFP